MAHFLCYIPEFLSTVVHLVKKSSNMISFKNLFGRLQSVIIGMIHVKALPGTPGNIHSIQNIVDHCCREAEIYQTRGIDALLVENMNDIPYLNSEAIGHEITAAMTRICTEVRAVAPHIPCGIQVLAAGNKQALAVSAATGCDFIRAEGFVFAHVADEGIISACAGPLLRYRKLINVENVKIFTDIKKKHSSHSITSDIDIQTTAYAAKFFLSDGIILTGKMTGDPVDYSELKKVQKTVTIPVIIGSGVTKENLHQYVEANALIIGSYFKKHGRWNEDLDENRIAFLMDYVHELRHKRELK